MVAALVDTVPTVSAVSNWQQHLYPRVDVVKYFSTLHISVHQIAVVTSTICCSFSSVSVSGQLLVCHTETRLRRFKVD